MQGRHKKPIELVQGHRTKAEIQERKEQEQTYGNIPRLHLVPPDELTDRAREKFIQIANEAFWLDELSTDLLAAYCLAWDRWLTLAEIMRNEPDTYSGTDENGNIILKKNPNRAAMTEYAQQMSTFSAKLGLGNIDRLKLMSPQKEKKNAMASFLDEIAN